MSNFILNFGRSKQGKSLVLIMTMVNYFNLWKTKNKRISHLRSKQRSLTESMHFLITIENSCRCARSRNTGRDASIEGE